MKKILPLMVVSILIMGGLGTLAIPFEKESLDKQDFSLEILVEGGLLGYWVTIANVGNESVEGSYTINITTEASSFMLLGGELGKYLQSFSLEPEYPIRPFLRPVIGFGSAKISISGKFETPTGGIYPFSAQAKGFIFLFYILMAKTKINLP